MTYWFTADDHFFHKNILKYCNRPFKSLEHMHMELIRRWNERVKDGDVVYVLGDFGFLNTCAQYREIADQLHGNIILIRGNHDDRESTGSIMTSCTINIGGVDWNMSHIPDFRFKYNLCGHVHNNWDYLTQGDKIVINVGVDIHNFYPISINEIISLLPDKYKIKLS